jgi:hypothetical protein
MIKDRHFADGTPMPAAWDDAYAAGFADFEKAYGAAKKKFSKASGSNAATSPRGLDSIINSALAHMPDDD